MRLLTIDFTVQHLFDDSDYPVGGWAVELRAWLQGFRASGTQIAILTTENASNSIERLGEAKLLRVYAPRGRVPGLTYLSRFLPRTFAAARRFRPDVVFQATFGVNTGLMYLLSRVVRCPFVYRCANDIDVDNRYRARLARAAPLFALGFSRADGYIAQNKYQLDAIRRRFPHKPAIVLHNPYLRRNSPTVIRSGRGYVAWLGIFQPQKNLPLLARLAESLPDIPFRVAGKSYADEKDPATEAAVTRLKELPNVTFLGYLRRSEVAAFLSEAVLLLSTSHYEGFSNTFLEAWGVGTPTVVPSRIDPDDLVANKELGRAVADDAELADAISALTHLPDNDYDRLSRHCRDYVETEHDPERLAKRFIAFLRSEIL